MAALTEEQSMIQDQAKAWAAEQSPVQKFREMRDSGAPLGFTPATWESMVVECLFLTLPAIRRSAAFSGTSTSVPFRGVTGGFWMSSCRYQHATIDKL